ncbi:CapA family protein [Limosilactobacillus caecicola]|uniref:CapA family protein n=1 Tax=Limosilactobacillus caecicola TaxID=2941332 RepID=UPI00203E4F0B|nr:CapA family protein [Limosilactobacillus caecicola]
MKITLTGDSLFSSTNLNQRLDPAIITILDAAQINFTNAEFTTPRSTTAPAAGRGYTTAVAPNRIAELTNLGFNLINFANNHSGDFGIQGILDTYRAATNAGIEPLGIGRSYDEAIKPRFIDLPNLRVAIVSATTTRSEVFLASNAGNGVAARPGVNPLRWQRTYVVDPEKFTQLQRINQELGTARSQSIGTAIERWDKLPNNQLYLGSMYQEKLLIEKGNQNYVKTTVNQHDLTVIKKQLADARRRADYVIFDLHTHEGVAENWYADEPAQFVKTAAHEIIDAGADVFVGHGAHFLRGIEHYHGKPIFYNLGSFLMEFEAGESLIPPEMYAEYHLPTNSVPSALHGSRAQDQAGHFVGFNGDPVFSQGALVQIELKTDGPHYYLYPTDLRMQDQRNLNRGIPVLADEQQAQLVIERLQKLSSQFTYDGTTHELKFKN